MHTDLIVSKQKETIIPIFSFHTAVLTALNFQGTTYETNALLPKIDFLCLKFFFFV